MKKIGLLTVIVLILYTLSVGANEAVLEKTVDISSGMIYVNGVSDKPEELMTIQVFNGGKTPYDFIAQPKAADAYSVWVGEEMTGDDGNFSFQFKYSGDVSETLNGFFAFESDILPREFYVDFTSYGDYERLMGSLNDAADSANPDFDEFYSLCEANKTALCPDLALAGDINFESAAKLFFNEVKKDGGALLVSDSVKNQKRFMNCIVAQSANENKLLSVNAVADKLDVDESLLADIKQVSDDSVADNYFAQLLNGKSIDDNAEFVSKIKESMILAYVAYPDGFLKLKELCENNAAFIGIAGKNYGGSAYKAIAGSTPTTLKDLRDRLDAAAQVGGGAAGGGAGGGGGGGATAPSGDSFGIKGDNKPVNTVPEVKMPFDDMVSAGWAYTAVSVLADKGIVNGKTATEFYPNDYVTREEFVKMLVGALNLATDGSADKYFSDVDKNEWYADFVYTAYKNGVCKGVSETEFGVGRNIIRQDAAVMIYNVLSGKAAGEALKFEDAAEISDYAKNAVSTLSSMEIINGKGNNRFEPLNTLTRAEAAQIIYKSFFAE